MSEIWDYYLTKRSGRLESIYSNLELAKDAPKEGYEILFSVCVNQKYPRPDGLTTNEEAKSLWALEDALVSGVRECAIYAGRITTCGRRDFYFYAKSKDAFETIISSLLRPFDYKFETTCQIDRGWNIYFKRLYPSPEDWQRIMNRRALENLKQNGDDLSQPRHVYHWLYFSSDADRNRCADAALGEGFTILSLAKSANRKKKYPIGLELWRLDSVMPAAIDVVTLKLFDLALENGGEYDGWETQIVKSGEKPIDDTPKPNRSE